MGGGEVIVQDWLDVVGVVEEVCWRRRRRVRGFWWVCFEREDHQKRMKA